VVQFDYFLAALSIALLAMIGMVETRVARKRERPRAAILSLLRQTRRPILRRGCPRSLGNRLHWVLDVVFHDNLARLRSGNGPQNMAVVKHMAMNLVRNPKDKHSLKVRRKLANLNQEYLETLIRRTTPLT
jgi:hypothetical protein